MLRTKSVKSIVLKVSQEWDVTIRQAYRYIHLARREWQKYFTNVKHAGISYHITQLRDLKRLAYIKKVVVGTGKDKKVITVPDLSLVLDIAKEEAKILGTYPSEKHDVALSGEINVTVDAKQKLAKKLAALAVKREEEKERGKDSIVSLEK